MVDRKTRVKKKKFRKTPGGVTVIHYSRDKKSSAKCAINGTKLPGTGNQTKSDSRKKGKSTRRPSLKFGGILGSKARRELWENYALVTINRKKIEEVPTKIKNLLTVKAQEVKK